MRAWARYRRRILITLAVTLAQACTPTDQPLADEPLVLSTDGLRVLGTTDAIATVHDLDVLTDGSVWVLNSAEPFLIGFDADGDLISAYGARGGGPDEFDAPAGFVTGPRRASTWVLDARRNVLVEVPRPASGRSEIALDRDSLPPGSLQPGMGMMSPLVRSARMDDGFVTARSFGTLRAGIYSFWNAIWGADLVAVDERGGHPRTILSLSAVLGDPTAYLEQTNGFPPVPLWFRLWTTCPDGTVRVHDRMQNTIRAFSGAGTELASTSLPEPAFDEVTDRQFARAVFALSAAEVAGRVGGRLSPEDSTRVMNQMMQSVEGTPERLARFLPRYVDLRCAEDGALWVQPIDLERSNLEGGRHWIRIGPDGATRDVLFPDRFQPYRFDAEAALGVLKDDLDVATVARVDFGGPW